MTTALMMDGSTLTPAAWAASVKGDEAAVPLFDARRGSLEGTIRPTMKMTRM